jgi:hypothetical protein
MTLPAYVSLPAAVAITLASALLSAGITWGATVGRISEGERSTARIERRVEKLEDAVARMLPLLERIDERTGRIERRP